MALTLMKGSEAVAEAAIRAGARFFFGYPITPQTEIPEYMSARLPEVGGCFLQAESEVAAINMVYGAAATGERVITSSSSPGVSLKQEGISYMAGARLPAVILNVMRGGPGLGSIQASQGDYFQATKGGGNGDYHLLTYAPASIQEAIDIMMFAYDKAEKYRVPCLMLADGIMCQMMEPVEMPEMVDFKVDPEKKPWAVTGWKPGDDPKKRAVINSLFITTEELSFTHEIDNVVPVPQCVDIADNYYVKEGLYFDNVNKNALSLIFKTAIEDGEDHITIKCSNDAVYQEMKYYLLDEQRIFDYMPEGTESLSYGENTDMHTITFLIKQQQE